MEQQIPQFIAPYLWSYNLSKIDVQKHKNIIIKNILNYGDTASTNWLKETYSDQEIRDTISRSTRTEWSKKSINLWSLIYNVSPKEMRF